MTPIPSKPPRLVKKNKSLKKILKSNIFISQETASLPATEIRKSSSGLTFQLTKTKSPTTSPTESLPTSVTKLASTYQIKRNKIVPKKVEEFMLHSTILHDMSLISRTVVEKKNAFR